MIKQFLLSFSLLIFVGTGNAQVLPPHVCQLKNTEKLVSAEARNHGYRYLAHYTSPDVLPSIIKNGRLLRRGLLSGLQMGLGNDAVYVQIAHQSWRGGHAGCLMSSSVRNLSESCQDAGKDPNAQFNWNRVVLTFDLGLLDDSEPYTAMADWGYGKKFHNGYAAFLPENFRCFAKDDKENSYGRNEIVFKDQVDLKYLKEIWVHPSKKQALVAHLKAQGIHSIHSIPVESFVLGTETVR